MNQDVFRLICSNLDAALVVRLGLVSKKLTAAAHEKGVLYETMLREFPGITDLPRDRDCRYYLISLSIYYGPPWVELSQDEIYTTIGSSICLPEDWRVHIPISKRLCDVKQSHSYYADHASTRREVLECIELWKKRVSGRIKIYDVDYNVAMPVLENLESAFRSDFRFHDYKKAFGHILL